MSYASRQSTIASAVSIRHLYTLPFSAALLSLSLLGAGCGSGAIAGPPADGYTASDLRSVDEADAGDRGRSGGEIAVYGALTAAGVGLGAAGAYGMATAANAPEPTGSRPEFWAGFQGLVGGAVLAVPFGVLMATSLASRSGHEEHARAPSSDERGVDARAVVGLGSVGMSGEF